MAKVVEGSLRFKFFRLLSFLSFFWLLWGGGCASQGEFLDLKNELRNQRQDLLFLQKNIAEATRETLALQKDLSRLSTENKASLLGMESKARQTEEELKELGKSLRQNQAEIKARLDGLQAEMLSLTGKWEETRHYQEKVLQESSSFRKEYLSRLEGLEKKIEDLKERVKFLEGALASKPSSQPSPPVTSLAPLAGEKEALSPEALYQNAYNKFKDGSYPEAREEFRKYLKQFPNTPYANNAQYWIGESFYQEKRYEEAIVEFQEVIEKYPRGNKVPSALLKQGLAFYQLGEKNNARLLWQKVIDKYPNSEQAQIAKAKLKELK